MEYTMTNRLAAEFIGTFVLVLGGCGAAVLAAGWPGVGIGYAGVALAFGLTVLCMVYAVGYISGGHFNPAVTVGLAAGKRFPWREVPHYLVAQVIGGAVAGLVLYIIANGLKGFDAAASGFATNGYGDRSPQGFNLGAGMVTEIVLTAIFLIVILGATHGRAPVGFAGLAIGLALTLIHLISIPVTNTSVNPARSTGVALFAGAEPLKQLWMFWLCPIIGGAIGALFYKGLLDTDGREPAITGQRRR